MPAFPSAEGYGANATGGRGGTVYEVTSLIDTNTPGTFRYAMQQSGARTIVFRVSGRINLLSNMSVLNGDLTIAGQTSPGGGIQISDREIQFGAGNIIIRFVRFRCGIATSGTLDSCGFWSSASGANVPMSNIILDHCTFQWGTDGCLDFQGDITDVTVQWCLLAENVAYRGSPGANLIGSEPWYGRQLRFSVHHNLYAHSNSRNPHMGSYITAGQVMLSPSNLPVFLADLRNNVVYDHYASGGSTGLGTFHNNLTEQIAYYNKTTTPAGVANIIGCIFKNGPDYPTDPAVGGVSRAARLYFSDCYCKLSPSTGTGDWSLLQPTLEDGLSNDPQPNPPIRQDHYWGDYNPDAPPSDNGEGITYPSVRSLTPYSVAAVTTHPVGQVLEVVLRNVGPHLVYRSGVATIIRDGPEERICGTTTGSGGTVRNGTGQCFMSSGVAIFDYPTYAVGTYPTDSNSDGVPDAWAVAHGFSITTALNTLVDGDGYTYLENYLNELAGDVASVDTTPPAAPTNVFVS